MLVFGRRGKVLKDHQKDEQIVDAQRFFDDVTGEKFQRLLLAPREIEAQVEKHREGHPNHAPGCRLFD